MLFTLSSSWTLKSHNKFGGGGASFLRSFKFKLIFIIFLNIAGFSLVFLKVATPLFCFLMDEMWVVWVSLEDDHCRDSLGGSSWASDQTATDTNVAARDVLHCSDSASTRPFSVFYAWIVWVSCQIYSAIHFFTGYES